MDPGSEPVELQGLTQTEEMLIAQCCPIMRVLHLKGGQLGYGGHVVNVAQDISTLAAALPRLAADVPIIIIRREGQEPGQHKPVGMRHLLKYFRDGRYRFASHPRFPHWCQNMLERHRMLSQAQVYLKQNPGDAAMTIEHMRILFRSGSPLAQQLTQRMCRYGANITGSRPYWYAKQQELQAIFATKGCATLFFTLSAADTHWDGL
ncbi:unnamed protein product [Ectocarpus sp. CCAP 1310/34]|nr:unnamed protein product [Ectocarpus sp. CCAP 1310/34]